MYVDNELFISGSPQDAEAARIRASDSLSALGFPLHEVVDHACIIERIGLELDGVKLQARLSSARRWRLRQAWVALRRHPFLSGRQFEVLVGHLTHAMLLNRPALSCFRAVYDFTRRHYHTPRTLWPSVYDELRAAFALLPVLTVSWCTPWSSTMGCSDASLFGYAVHESDCKLSLVTEVGAWSDRWRFRLGAGTRRPPRLRAWSR